VPTVVEPVPRLARPALVACVLAGALLAVPPLHAAGSRTVLNYGDSLAIGTDLYLDAYLRGWSVRSETEISRHATDVPSALRGLGPVLPRVIVVSAGTNDDPGALSRFAQAVRETLAVAGPTRCVVWSTIVRPPYQGVSYAGYNHVLRSAARRHASLRVLDWAAMARTHPRWFGRDGVHPSMAGYRARAAATARLVQGCGP
jgi:GDSL-like Lipase/Acylhydrolase family